MVLATLGALAGQYAMDKVSANSANKASKKATTKAALLNYYLQDQLMDKQINWERERATHAHQWEMQDLKDAGLNPALTAMGGQGANTSGISAGGALTTPGATKGVNLGRLLNYTNTAKQNAQRDRELDQQFAQIQSNITKQDAETLNIIKEGKWINPKNQKALKEAESRIINNTSQSAKNIAEAGKFNEDTKATQGGLIAKAFGTEPSQAQAVVNVLGLIGGGGAVGGGIKAFKALKSLNTARKFGKFVNSIGK